MAARFFILLSLLSLTLAFRLNEGDPPRRASLKCTPDNGGRCVYKISTPATDGGLLTNLTATVTTCLTDYDRLESDFNGYEDSYMTKSEQLDSLTAQIDEIDQNMKDFLQLYEDLKQLLYLTVKNVTAVGNYINGLKNGNCYQRCIQAATVAPNPKTTTPVPTVYDPCSQLNCSANQYFPAECASSGTFAYCKCAGNLDKTGNCTQSKCVSKDDSTSLTIDRAGPLWSPGYTYDNKVSYNSTGNCYWKIFPDGKNMTIRLNSSTIANSMAFDKNTKITLTKGTTSGVPYTKVMPITIASDTVFNKFMDSMTYDALYLEITVDTPTFANETAPHFFDWTLAFV